MKKILIFVAFIQCSNSYAAIEVMPERLVCTVQGFVQISVNTNATNSISTNKMTPDSDIVVTYEKITKSQILERYAIDSKFEKKSLYNEGYSSGGTQYLNTQDKNEVITYFGKQGKYYIIVKFIRTKTNEGGIDEGWRSYSFFNVHMACVNPIDYPRKK